MVPFLCICDAVATRQRQVASLWVARLDLEIEICYRQTAMAITTKLIRIFAHIWANVEESASLRCCRGDPVVCVLWFDVALHCAHIWRQTLTMSLSPMTSVLSRRRKSHRQSETDSKAPIQNLVLGRRTRPRCKCERIVTFENVSQTGNQFHFGNVRLILMYSHHARLAI